jgi:hypothetical protein
MNARVLTYDQPADEEQPYVGDVLETFRKRSNQPTGTRYVILAVRVVKARAVKAGHVRYSLVVARVESVMVGTRTLPMYWYQAEQTRRHR